MRVSVARSETSTLSGTSAAPDFRRLVVVALNQMFTLRASTIPRRSSLREVKHRLGRDVPPSPSYLPQRRSQSWVCPPTCTVGRIRSHTRRETMFCSLVIARRHLLHSAKHLSAYGVFGQEIDSKPQGKLSVAVFCAQGW